MILSDFLKALGQVGDRGFRGVLFWSLGLTIGLLALFVYATAALLGWVLPDSVTLPWIGEISFLVLWHFNSGRYGSFSRWRILEQSALSRL